MVFTYKNAHRAVIGVLSYGLRPELMPRTSRRPQGAFTDRGRRAKLKFWRIRHDIFLLQVYRLNKHLP